MTEYPFSGPSGLTKLMGVSRSYLRDRRERGDWKERIHWVYLKPGVSRGGIRYNTKLCMHWLARQDDRAHEAAIDAYLKHLESLELRRVY